VVRGEIGDRVKGIVRGKIWLQGRAEPVVLELEGNSWPDLAGCRFHSPTRRNAFRISTWIRSIPCSQIPSIRSRSAFYVARARVLLPGLPAFYPYYSWFHHIPSILVGRVRSD
jgi:hypothetical protein